MICKLIQTQWTERNNEPCQSLFLGSGFALNMYDQSAVPPQAVSSYYVFVHAMATVYFQEILPSQHIRGHS